MTNDKCTCEPSTLIISNFSNYHSSQIKICGNIEQQIHVDTFIVSECQIVNCNDGSYISDHRNDGISKVILLKQKDGLLVRETQYIIDTSDNVICVPTTEVKLTFDGDKMAISPERDIFTAPHLTKRQKESLAILCKDLKIKFDRGDTHYAHDEKSIYLLYMGAINGDEDAIYLFKNLSSLFDLGGGAIEDTRSELISSYIK